MAKFEGDQNVPSEWLDSYRATLNPHPTGKVVKKRYPFRMPRMQEGGPGVHPSQVAQRERFKKAVSNFKNVSAEVRSRWYAAEPPYSSFLWYYNYFLMSSLVGNANLNQGGVGVIKSIQFVSKSIPVGGDEAITITEVDPTKTVVMLFGNSYIADKVQRGTDSCTDGSTKTVSLSPNVDPAICEVKLQGQAGFQEIVDGTGDGKWGGFYVSSLSTTQLIVGLTDIIGSASYPFSWEIIEHKAQTVYPYIKSIAAEAVTISWPVTPSVAAVIGAIVIEYI